MLAREILTNSHNEYYEKSFNGLVADARLLVDGGTWSAYKASPPPRRERLT